MHAHSLKTFPAVHVKREVECNQIAQQTQMLCTYCWLENILHLKFLFVNKMQWGFMLAVVLCVSLYDVVIYIHGEGSSYLVCIRSLVCFEIMCVAVTFHDLDLHTTL